MASIFDNGSGLDNFLNSNIGAKLTDVFTDTLSNIGGGLIKTKSNVTTSNGQQLQSPIVYQNNPNAGGLMNSLGLGTSSGQPNYLMIGALVAGLGLILWLVFKK